MEDNTKYLLISRSSLDNIFGRLIDKNSTLINIIKNDDVDPRLLRNNTFLINITKLQYITWMLITNNMSVVLDRDVFNWIKDHKDILIKNAVTPILISGPYQNMSKADWDFVFKPERFL